MFVKGRTGVVTNSLWYDTIDADATRDIYAHRTAAIADLGAVFEGYVGRRGLVRIDMGDVLTSFGASTVSSRNAIVGTGHTPAPHSIQMSIGAGVRF